MRERDCAQFMFCQLERVTHLVHIFVCDTYSCVKEYVTSVCVGEKDQISGVCRFFGLQKFTFST